MIRSGMTLISISQGGFLPQPGDMTTTQSAVNEHAVGEVPGKAATVGAVATHGEAVYN